MNAAGVELLIADLKEILKIDNEIIACRNEVSADIGERLLVVSDVVRYNTAKVLNAFRETGFGEHHLSGSTGYAYDDIGRDNLEAVYAKVFGSEAALVRIQIVSGTHALSLVLFGVLRPNDLLISLTGQPYDTMASVIGYRREARGSLKEHNVRYEEISLKEDGSPDLAAIEKVISEKNPRLVLIQRSRGYTWRDSLSTEDIRKISECVKRSSKDTIIFVDNCYGEFTDILEPTQCGADIMAGSLIKNPGGGISPSGGYVAGKADLVEMAAERLTAPGLGSHCGPSLGFTRQMAQGFFLAPMIVGEAVSGSIFASRFLERMGFEVSPHYLKRRDDIVLSVNMKDVDTLLKFTAAIQSTSPIDAFLRPEPAPMPGYEDDVVMAAGAFTQGSSIELSADAPIRPPYTVYMQGGLNRYQVELAILKFASAMKSEGKFNFV